MFFPAARKRKSASVGGLLSVMVRRTLGSWRCAGSQEHVHKAGSREQGPCDGSTFPRSPTPGGLVHPTIMVEPALRDVGHAAMDRRKHYPGGIGIMSPYFCPEPSPSLDSIAFGSPGGGGGYPALTPHLPWIPSPSVPQVGGGGINFLVNTPGCFLTFVTKVVCTSGGGGTYPDPASSSNSLAPRNSSGEGGGVLIFWLTPLAAF